MTPSPQAAVHLPDGWAVEPITLALTGHHDLGREWPVLLVTHKGCLVARVANYGQAAALIPPDVAAAWLAPSLERMTP